MQNVVKYGKYSPVNLANFEYFSITRGKTNHFWAESGYFSARNTKILKICKILHGYNIFHILQHFATKLAILLNLGCSFELYYNEIFRLCCLDKKLVDGHLKPHYLVFKTI
jgi:hypothetical protein